MHRQKNRTVPKMSPNDDKDITNRLKNHSISSRNIWDEMQRIHLYSRSFRVMKIDVLRPKPRFKIKLDKSWSHFIATILTPWLNEHCLRFGVKNPTLFKPQEQTFRCDFEKNCQFGWDTQKTISPMIYIWQHHHHFVKPVFFFQPDEITQTG